MIITNIDNLTERRNKLIKGEWGPHRFVTKLFRNDTFEVMIHARDLIDRKRMKINLDQVMINI